MNVLGIGSIVESVSKVADDLVTSDEERLKIALEGKQIDADIAKSQMEVNKVEAASTNLFVSGWRPCIGWIGAIAIGYQFVLYPLMVWAWTIAQDKGLLTTSPPPVLDADVLFALITGMLGIAGLRSFDKVKGKAR
mgnify:CR=1 FL=1